MELIKKIRDVFNKSKNSIDYSQKFLRVSEEDYAYHILCCLCKEFKKSVYIDGVALNIVLEMLGVKEPVTDEFSALKSIDFQNTTLSLYLSIIKDSNGEYSYLEYSKNEENEKSKPLKGTNIKKSEFGFVSYCPKDIGEDIDLSCINGIALYEYLDIICKYYVILTRECFSVESNLYLKAMSLNLLFFVHTNNQSQDRIIDEAKDFIVKQLKNKNNDDFTIMSLDKASSYNETIAIITANSFFKVYNKLGDANDKKRLIDLLKKCITLHNDEVSNIRMSSH